ncbi:Arm DNA-binding domain-containing protein [Roseobacter sp. CCS2]|uniref:Arm DNA-binding domain-containing protein n=1 Tax=Roseobacter sp. CCS2 TaxID=391593 RepID=UPI003FA475E9
MAPNVLKTTTVGKHADAGGPYLFITRRDAKGHAKGSWMFRYTFLKKRCELGLESVRSYTLAQAEIKRDRWRDLMTDKRTQR